MRGGTALLLLARSSCPGAALQPRGVPSLPLLTHPGSKGGRLSSACFPGASHLQPDPCRVCVGCWRSPLSPVRTVPGRAALLQQVPGSSWAPSSPFPTLGFSSW